MLNHGEARIDRSASGHANGGVGRGRHVPDGFLIGPQHQTARALSHRLSWHRPLFREAARCPACHQCRARDWLALLWPATDADRRGRGGALAAIQRRTPTRQIFSHPCFFGQRHGQHYCAVDGRGLDPDYHLCQSGSLHHGSSDDRNLWRMLRIGSAGLAALHRDQRFPPPNGLFANTGLRLSRIVLFPALLRRTILRLANG